jgi:hypothetical protein
MMTGLSTNVILSSSPEDELGDNTKFRGWVIFLFLFEGMGYLLEFFFLAQTYTMLLLLLVEQLSLRSGSART